MGGLARIARSLGGITINGKRYVWDYVADKAVPEEEMPFGSERHAASEKVKLELLQKELHAAAVCEERKE